MDIRMPEMDGIRAVSELRKIDPYVSVIMLTGYGTLQTAQQAMLAGANQYLRKPPDVLELLEAVSRQAAESRLRRTQAEAARSALEMNSALKKEMSAAAPSVWLGKASAELVHDLSNPLTVVIGYADLLATEIQALKSAGGAVPDHLMQYSGVIKNAAEYCRHLSQNWRRASGEVPRMEKLSIKSVVEDSVSLLSEETSGVKILSSGDLTVKGAKYELKQY
jgi:response regulator RpfG family c-di-GMP phosphodiesterase